MYLQVVRQLKLPKVRSSYVHLASLQTNPLFVDSPVKKTFIKKLYTKVLNKNDYSKHHAYTTIQKSMPFLKQKHHKTPDLLRVDNRANC